MSVASHIVFLGHDVVGRTTPGVCGSAPDNTWEWASVPGPAVSGCGKDATSCVFKATASTDNTWAALCINGSFTQQGPWESCDYYGVPAKGVGVIEGHVKDEDGSPVAGVTVDANGKGGASTTTGADGYYAMQVQPGSYQIVPSGGPHGKSAPEYRPKVNVTSIAAGSSGTADFTLQSGIKLELHFDKSVVPADGLQVVDGTITTTEFGNPVSVGVQLQGMFGESPLKAVTAGPLASVCSSGTRVWPTGTLQGPDGSYVTVTTDATGHYSLAIAVGTTPGVWRLNAWAKNTNGTLSTDTAQAYDTQSITFNGLPGPKTTPADFALEFDKAATTKAAGLEQISSMPSVMVGTLAQTNATESKETQLGALAFALVNARDGQSVLVFPADRPPEISPTGDISNLKVDAGDLVIDPAEWTGAGLPASVGYSLQAALDKGDLQQVPTLSEFETGQKVSGWKTVRGNQVTLSSTSFEYLGWGYQAVAAPGACF
ncbi:MAG: carboxypeptidase regulatory-like domain-containing protein [Acidimicrobiales bacterium]